MQIASVDTKAGVAICCAPSRMAAMSPFPGLEEHLDHADATQGLRFDAPDIIDGARGHILTVGGDTCGHVVRGEAAILSEDSDGRNIDRGEDVRRHVRPIPSALYPEVLSPTPRLCSAPPLGSAAINSCVVRMAWAQVGPFRACAACIISRVNAA